MSAMSGKYFHPLGHVFQCNQVVGYSIAKYFDAAGTNGRNALVSSKMYKTGKLLFNDHQKKVKFQTMTVNSGCYD
jgi:hypothetical protein